MIDCCRNIYLYAIYFTFRIGPEEENPDNDYKEYINPMFMKR
jgi:hypothetical protein